MNTTITGVNDLEKFVVNGGKPLNGEVTIGGAKNSVVAILPATILAQGVCTIDNIPNISDVKYMKDILTLLGSKIEEIDEHTLKIDTTNVKSVDVPYELTSHLRASYYFIGALLGRFSSARVGSSGGCDLSDSGNRPIDIHLSGFQKLGAKLNIKAFQEHFIDLQASELVSPGTIFLSKVSVGATINVMLASCRATGTVYIENAAKEPHIVDLANFLNSMGAQVSGAGTDRIKIVGVKQMHGCEYSIIPDQIEAGTYMVAAAATQGDVLIKNVIPKHLEVISSKLIESGAEVTEYDDSVRVKSSKRPSGCRIDTMPYPGFPTDMQPQIATLLSIADGQSAVTEGVWDSRFAYTEQLKKMGADIEVTGCTATVRGVEQLHGASVEADDLRAGAAMIIAGLMADGQTTIGNIDHIERGYENVIDKFKAIGADITRVSSLD